MVNGLRANPKIMDKGPIKPGTALDRRQFLKAAAAGAAQLGGLAYAAPSGEASAAAAADWQGLARMLQGPLLQNGAPDFARVAAPWNLLC